MTANQISIEAAVAIISEYYSLDVEAVAEMLENLGSITVEQRERVNLVYSALKAKETLDNQMKRGTKL